MDAIARRSIKEILLQDKSDVRVLKEALLEGYYPREIRMELQDCYPLSYPTPDHAYKFYFETALAIPEEFFTNLKQFQS